MKIYHFVMLLSCTLSCYAVHAAVTSPASTETVVTAPPTQHDPKINLNTADLAALTGSFKGIGKKRAEAIVRYREEHGHFTSVSQLSQVRGLGLSFVSRHLSQLQAIFSVD